MVAAITTGIFDLESHPGCLYDRLEISCGDGAYLRSHMPPYPKVATSKVCLICVHFYFVCLHQVLDVVVNNSSTLLGHYCGDRAFRNPVYGPDGEALSFELSTDHSVVEYGFQIHYSVIRKSTSIIYLKTVLKHCGKLRAVRLKSCTEGFQAPALQL